MKLSQKESKYLVRLPFAPPFIFIIGFFVSVLGFCNDNVKAGMIGIVIVILSSIRLFPIWGPRWWDIGGTDQNDEEESNSVTIKDRTAIWLFMVEILFIIFGLVGVFIFSGWMMAVSILALLFIYITICVHY